MRSLTGQDRTLKVDSAGGAGLRVHNGDIEHEDILGIGQLYESFPL